MSILNKYNENNKSIFRGNLNNETDFTEYNRFLPDKINGTDIDFILERKGNMLIVEEKESIASLSNAQLQCQFLLAFNTWKSGKYSEYWLVIRNSKDVDNQTILIYDENSFNSYIRQEKIIPYSLFKNISRKQKAEMVEYTYSKMNATENINFKNIHSSISSIRSILKSENELKGV